MRMRIMDGEEHDEDGEEHDDDDDDDEEEEELFLLLQARQFERPPPKIMDFFTLRPPLPKNEKNTLKTKIHPQYCCLKQGKLRELPAFVIWAVKDSKKLVERLIQSPMMMLENQGSSLLIAVVSDRYFQYRWNAIWWTRTNTILLQLYTPASYHHTNLEAVPISFTLTPSLHAMQRGFVWIDQIVEASDWELPAVS